MFLAILGVLDIIGGILLGLSGFIPYIGSGLVSTFGIILIIKGIISYISGAAKGFFLDFMGILDIIAGIMLVLATYGFVIFFFPYIGILLLLKGIYSVIIGLVK
ncbi:MAG: hypothetical protein KAU24_02245 [Candidatus Aenigmarchaeota archaeon]|nr:hypothetical protein [Candidatus Aenigmarchaeota archaeon]